MNALWTIPATLTVVALLVTWWTLRTVGDEALRLRRELRAIPVLADRSRAVRAQAERTGDARHATHDSFGSRLRQ
jgi:hypothetical protein